MPKQTPCFPAIMSMKDLASGGAIAATIHYYCPQLVRLEGEQVLSVAFGVAENRCSKMNSYSVFHTKGHWALSPWQMCV